MSAPVDEVRDEYADAMNLELRQSIAARVLEAMDVDQYLIDAVRNAKPPVEQVKPAIEEPMEFGSVVRKVLRDGRELRWCRTYSVRVDEPWCTGNHMGSWAEILEDATDVEVLRIGVGERPDVAPEETDDYKLGVSDTTFNILTKLRVLRSEAITSERKNAYDVAIKTVEAMQP